jgi:hypothetical protein
MMGNRANGRQCRSLPPQYPAIAAPLAFLAIEPGGENRGTVAERLIPGITYICLHRLILPFARDGSRAEFDDDEPVHRPVSLDCLDPGPARSHAAAMERYVLRYACEIIIDRLIFDIWMDFENEISAHRSLPLTRAEQPCESIDMTSTIP